ncbi:hypothetical protein Mapa_009310 [Marchantia paleacea]|nr:hypothetical protein Mapa_009310 [Marchantia paleacea]
MGWVTKASQSLESVPLNGVTPPTDVANLAYLVFFSLGAAVLLPWNAYISAVDYFDYLYPGTHIDRVFAVVYMFPCLIVLLYLTLNGQHYTTSFRVNGGLALYLLAVVLVPIMDTLFITDEGSTFTHYATVASLALTGVADALVQGSVIGAAGELPERYMQAFVAGTAACGVLVSALRIVTKAAFPATIDGLRMSANLYFIVSGCFLAFCIVAYNLAHNLPIMIYHRNVKLAAMADESSALEGPITSKSDLATEEARVPHKPSSAVTFGLNNDTALFVLSQIRWLVTAMVVMYVITLSIFPGFLAEDVHSLVLGDWYPILLIGAYNVFDLVGKTATAVYILDSNTSIVGGTFGRLIFFPLYYVCLHGPKSLRTEIPVFTLTSLFGLTNGYYSSCLLIVAPKAVPYAAAETAGMVMTIALILGLAIGSVVSFVWIV